MPSRKKAASVVPARGRRVVYDEENWCAAVRIMHERRGKGHIYRDALWRDLYRGTVSLGEADQSRENGGVQGYLRMALILAEQLIEDGALDLVNEQQARQTLRRAGFNLPPQSQSGGRPT